jgi:M6 family metalloprotease-like protein
MKTHLTLCSVIVLASTACASDFTSDFEAGYLRGWTRTGTAFDSQPTLGDNPTARGRGQPSEHQGNWWIGTYENYQGKPGQTPGDVQDDGLTGTLTSPPFVILGEEINFLIGGGNHDENDPAGATVVLFDIEGVSTASFTGNNSETMTRVHLPVGAFKGMTAVLKIIDNSTGSWGHINCDDFQMLDGNGNHLPFTANPTDVDRCRLAVHPAPSGMDWTTTLTTWVPIEDRGDPPIRSPRTAMSTGILTEDTADLKITFSGEVGGSPGSRVFVRALVDGQPALPSDVAFTAGEFSGTRSFDFIKQNLAAGGHWVEMQWTPESGTASVGDANLTLSSTSILNRYSRLMVKAAASGPVISTSSAAWQQIPEMSGSLTTPAATDVAITFGAEAFTSDTSHRMFVRALIDGQPTMPSDVKFAMGAFTGVRSFTFVQNNIAAGVHLITLEWTVDAGGTASIGDRTMTVVAAPEITKHGGVTGVAAPSGPRKTTTSTSWTDIPDLASSIATAANSQLEISFSAEVDSTSGKQLFVRALIDGQPANPTDVVFANGPCYGVRSATFGVTALTAGPHGVRLQWRVAGGDASIGDRTMILNYWRADAIDLSSPWSGLKPVVGKRNVLTILWDPHRTDHTAPSKSAIENLLFGSKPSVADYFLENSGGRFQLVNAGVLGWYDALQPATYYWGPIDTGDANGDGWIHPHVQKWAEAIRTADPQFNYAAYDANKDGYLSPDELSILMVIPQNTAFGTMNYPVGREVPVEPLIVDGVKIDRICEAYVGAPPSLGVLAHELAHLMLNAGDMYFSFFQPYAAGPYSLMDQSPNNAGHLDPLHKLRLGWLTPQVVTSNRWYQLRDIETSQEVLLLYDPVHGPDEYFLVENRWRGSSYDSALPYSGLGVWQIIENPTVYGSLPVPPSVDSALWNDSAWTGWARRGIRMIRPIYGPPFNTALWDQSNAQTGYDLLSVDGNASHVTLRWANGSPSGYSLLCMPVPGPTVTVGVMQGSGNLVGPPLSIRFSSNKLVFTWPGTYACFQLEVASKLAPQPDWAPVGIAPQISGESYQVTFQAPIANRFYRLHKP